MTSQEYREKLKKGNFDSTDKKSKLNNIITEYESIKFHSKAEAARYPQLKVLQKVGEIKNLKLQPKYLLQDAFKKNGKTYQAMHYIADFEYIDTKTGQIVIEDVKGFETDVYKLKRKLFEFKYPTLTITEIKM